MRDDKRTIRCAVYTRKSTEEGLEQEFNSLDAQREACVAYIASQRHEGWVLAPGHYDDGGFSGGNMQRPGLVRLMADIEAGKVDTIVVYKVDRLTRNLADFAKIVDVLDAKEASFVSITQSFNTTTSMGRLTLNVLLSFAQFEREVTGERIRDKIAASKKKGLWMGGPVPLGYVVQDRRLIVHTEEAELVRRIMRRYLALYSVKELIAELAAEGRVTKIQHKTSGPHRGGVPFLRGTLLHMLRNRIYLGEIVHKGTPYPGEHDAIVPIDLWEAVQAKLDGRDQCKGAVRQSKQISLLASKLYDADDRPMEPSHATKGGKRYRYYVTRPNLVDVDRPAWRVPAHGIETITITCIADMLSDQHLLHGMVLDSGSDMSSIGRALRLGQAAADCLRGRATSDQTLLLRQLLSRATLRDSQIDIELSRAAVFETIGIADADQDDEPIKLTSPAVRVRHGHEMKLIIPGTGERPKPTAQRNEKLVELIIEASAARDLVLSNPEQSMNRIAADANRCRTRLARMFGLSFLAPDIVKAILSGRQPKQLGYRDLMEVDLPMAWPEQRKVLGFV
jgi:site-specific DNA recombinase